MGGRGGAKSALRVVVEHTSSFLGLGASSCGLWWVGACVMECERTPSVSFSILIFLRATISPFFLSLAFWTHL